MSISIKESMQNFAINRALNYLEGNPEENIPKLMNFVDKYTPKSWFAVQRDAVREVIEKKVRLEFTGKQLDFIKNMCERTKKSECYEKTDFYRAVRYIEEKASDFTEREEHIVREAVSRADGYFEKNEIKYAFFHGDYTPWNTYYVNDELYAFDFEYCKRTMPCCMDIFHYFTQMCFLGKRYGVGKTVREYRRYRKLLAEYTDNPELLYMCYLLYIIAFYHKRTEGRTDLIAQKIEYWTDMLEYIRCKITPASIEGE